MMRHPSTDSMHDLLDDALPAEEEAAVREHLEACVPCREAYRRLEGAVTAMRGLPRRASPPPGTWEGIHARLQGADVPGVTPGSRPVRVLDFPGGAPPRRRGLLLSVRQLAAAAALVALVSGGAVWALMGGGGRGPSGGEGSLAEAPASVPGGAARRAATAGSEGYDDVIRELERLVERGRTVLAPETLTTLETSLEEVDAAVAEVRRALAEDPGSDLLRRMLVGHQTTKVRVLRQAATAIEARS